MVTAMSRESRTVLLVADQRGDQVAAIPIDSPFAEDVPTPGQLSRSIHSYPVR
jgi:hypothetical protein